MGETKIPGEGLLIRMWDTVIGNGIGGMLKPRQIRREARAMLDARRDEVLALAQADREAELIRRGELRIAEKVGTLTLVPATDEVSDGYVPSWVNPIGQVQANVLADAVRREVNVHRAILHAEDVLANDEQEPPPKFADRDWLFRWREAAGQVSSEEMQQLWGRLLAGEIKAPGSFSLRTLDFVRNISADEARLIERMAPLVFDDFIPKDAKVALEEAGLSLNNLLMLEDLGILNGVAGMLASSWKSEVAEEFRVTIDLGDQAMIVEAPPRRRQLELSACPLTKLGIEVMTLCPAERSERYLREVAGLLKLAGATRIQLAQKVSRLHGVRRLTDLVDLIPSPQPPNG